MCRCRLFRLWMGYSGDGLNGRAKTVGEVDRESDALLSIPQHEMNKIYSNSERGNPDWQITDSDKTGVVLYI